MLNDYKSTVPNGQIIGNGINHELIEIDISKAFNRSFTKISKMPTFNMFDVYKQLHKQYIKP